ncbi:MFS transporter [Nocardioides sp.]|uniref:MFS transporter n=1 Tax=Nocardioides sp. TaxID=35761 RepID=UPI0027167242|nr:MFS transporter [Nocardioides sp.]MDO9458323.1 MFS transporter [Nocardioides sp.]
MSTSLALSSAAGRWVLVATILGSALAGIDATVVNVALPALGQSLDAGFSTLQWTVSAYALTLASFILLGGTLGDRFGRRRVFVVGVVWFAVASLACGLSQDVGTLIAARALQGMGAALLTPGSLALLQVTFRAEDRARAIGAWSGLGGVATAIGPLLGGWLVDVASWRWVFLINLPLAALVVWIALRHVPETHDEGADGTSVDWTGGVLGAVALAGLTFVLIESSRGPVVVVVAVAVGLAGVVAFLLRERRAAYPVLPLGVFGSAQFSAVNGVTFLVYGGFGVVFFLLVVRLQEAAGFGPVAAGSALLPVTVLMLLLSSRSGALAARIGPRLQMSVGPLVCAGGLLLLAGVGPGDTYLADVLPGVVVFGLGLSVMVAPLTAAALGAAPDEHAGMASGVNNAVARTGGLVAVAAIPVLAGVSDGAADGFEHALWISAAILVGSGVVAALTVRNDVLEPDAPEPATQHLTHCGVGAPPLAASCDEQGRLRVTDPPSP